MAIYAYLYVCMGRIYFWVALIQKYIYGYIYMEVFSLQPRSQIFISTYILVGLAEMNFLCRYTNSETCSLTTYVIYERTHVCHRLCR